MYFLPRSVKLCFNVYVFNPPGLGFLTRDEENMRFLLFLIIFVTRPILQLLLPPLPLGHTPDTWGAAPLPGPLCPALVPRPLSHGRVGSPGTVAEFFLSPLRLQRCPGSSQLLSLLRHVAGFLKNPCWDFEWNTSESVTVWGEATSCPWVRCVCLLVKTLREALIKPTRPPVELTRSLLHSLPRTQCPLSMALWPSSCPSWFCLSLFLHRECG